MGRKCSHCGNIGHNSRTCSSYNRTGVRLFGVQLDLPTASSPPPPPDSSAAMKKSFSMNSLPAAFSSSSSSSASFSGYLSDGIAPTSPDRKKGVPWTEEEHMKFLLGLQKLGKGDWRGISRNFVVTKTPTQVASHAQKYFLRRATLHKKKRRASLFDMVSADDVNGVGVWKHGLISPDLGYDPSPNKTGSGSSGGGPDLELKLTVLQSPQTNKGPSSSASLLVISVT
ncbi:PREDICTED: transcription factor MYB1R1 [Tarenaya hassleriana]|uniref:transcription factor MYB1R1 n=1 Tax=Tarenaya hassleriana TaxID=28532 RepID=UPI00053C5CFA|nr:PREDICTED: transcription factor MYB1R1 [Tarenaya hassleriana]